MSNGRPRPSTSIRRSPPANPGHEPRGGADLKSLHSGWDRPAARRFLPFEDATIAEASNLASVTTIRLFGALPTTMKLLDHAGVTFEWKDYGIKAATGSRP